MQPSYTSILNFATAREVFSTNKFRSAQRLPSFSTSVTLNDFVGDKLFRLLIVARESSLCKSARNVAMNAQMLLVTNDSMVLI